MVMFGLPQIGMVYFILPIILFAQNIWIEKTHSDFIDGWEYYYLAGDTATQWNTSLVRRWELGGYIYSPATGGLRIIGRDWDLNDDGWLDVVLGRRGYGKADIYWNSSIGFDTTRKTVLQGLNTYPQGFSIGDLNFDNYEDIVIAEYNNRVHIFYGSVYGYSPFPNDSIVLGTQGAQHPLIADINDDGNNDIIVSSQNRIYFYYGPGPFHNLFPADSIVCTSTWINRLSLGDLNYDNRLDLSVSQGAGVRIYWGPNFLSFITLNAGNNADHSIADLNKDGYLDIFINQNVGSDIIYWGSNSGFNTSTNVPGSGGGDCSIECINNDNSLDIAANQLNVNAGYIIWGPNYNQFTSLPLSNSQMQVVNIADFDNNGEKDVLFGGAGGPAYLYWNNGGFSPANCFIFPDESDDAVWEDLGNLWDRTNKERYLSSVFDAGTIIYFDSVRWWGNFPQGIECSLWVRGAIDTTAWTRWILLPNGGTDTLLNGKRFLQYRCTFSTDYKRTTKFSFDSICFYYHSTGISEELTKNLLISCSNIPNPFSSEAFINFFLPTGTNVSLKIYNSYGELIKVLVDRNLNAGLHFVIWDGKDYRNKIVSSGVYFYHLEVGDFRKVGNLIFVK